MSKSSKIVLGIIGAIAVIAIGFWGFNQNQAPTNKNSANGNISINANIAATIQTTLQLDRGDGTAVKLFTVKVDKDTAALAQLQKIAQENSIVLEVKTENFGSYVDSLDGLKGGTDGKYWLYSVNGKAAEVGADQYKLSEGDVAEWKFTK